MAFPDAAKRINPKVISMIMPSRWLKGGKGLNSFREAMMNDECLTHISDYADARQCFPTVHIDGGICYFRWESDRKGDRQNVEYKYYSLNGEVICSQRTLKSEDARTVIRDARQQSIIKKSAASAFKSFSAIVSSRNPFGFNADLFNKSYNYAHIDLVWDYRDEYTKIYGVKGIKGGARRVSAYLPTSQIRKSIESIDKYKIFFSKAYMTTSTVPPEMILGSPNEICTETFLKIGNFDTKEEMLNCFSYIKSKFFRALLFFNRSSLNISKSTFDLIPIQDFTSYSDINWSKSTPEIDQQLYTKFHLTDEEIAFIEKMIKPM